MIYKKIIRDKKTKRLTTISMILFCIGFLCFLYGSIVIFTNYSVRFKFNDEEIDFFDGETLYFSTDVSVSCIEEGYNIYLDGRKQLSNSFILKEGSHEIVLKKHFNKYVINVIVDYSPEVFFEDDSGDMIHNYLSNNKAFIIRTDDIDSTVIVNNDVYDGNYLTKYSSYNVLVAGVNYNINILKY